MCSLRVRLVGERIEWSDSILISWDGMALFVCLVGEQEFRGPHRAKVWLSALVHYFWLADNRTDTVMLEPRVDNEK